MRRARQLVVGFSFNTPLLFFSLIRGTFEEPTADWDLRSIDILKRWWEGGKR
jgi:hypothetical protein